MSRKSVSLVGKAHAHGCAECGHWLEDACTTPTVDPVCRYCRLGLQRPDGYDGRAPLECCFDNCREATATDRAIHKLAGIRLWWFCRSCSRTHPTRPIRSTSG